MTTPLDILWQGQRAGRTDFEALPGGLDVSGGEALQLDVLARWRDAGEALGGWKVGLTSGRSRDAFGPGIRPFGYVLASRIHRSGDTIALATVPNLGVETEVCFRIGARLAGNDVTAADARRAVAAVMPAFELNQKRMPGTAPPAARTADNLSQWGIVIGPETALADVGNLDALVVTQWHDGTLQETVSAAGHIDDHFASLATLARELARFDLALDAGMHVITGAFTRAESAQPGRYTGRFEGLGEVSIAFAS